MNPAEVATSVMIEKTLAKSPAYRKVEDDLYVIKQGSAYVMINVISWGENKSMVRCVSQLVRGAEVTGELAMELLQLNSKLRFGAFAYERATNSILFVHTILGGDTLDAEELLATLRDVALVADEYDDKLVDTYGGQRMRDLLEDAALEHIIEMHPERFQFDQ